VNYSVSLKTYIAGGKAVQTDILTLPVSTPVEREIIDFVDYTGRTNAKDIVTIKPRVSGFLVKAFFKEGADVKKGDNLFEIDPRPYHAQLKAAEAAVAQQDASLRYAKATIERFKAIAKKQPGAVSDREIDQYYTQELQAIASLDLAKANLDAAKLDLDWCFVQSPIDGRVSRFYLTAGNMVKKDQTSLTTVMSMDPMYVYFDMDEATLLRIKNAIHEKKIVVPKGGLAVEMRLAGYDKKRFDGTINFFDSRVDPRTGSISVRGVFENPRLEGGDYLMAPGMSARVRLPISAKRTELLVIERAIGTDQGIKFVYVVDADNKVQFRRVVLGSLQGDGLRVIAQGLKKDDRILIGGLQQVRPKMTIQPELMTMPSPDNPAAPVITDPAKKPGEKENEK
jgi:membrane fusion protein, multidrug efflux system